MTEILTKTRLARPRLRRRDGDKILLELHEGQDAGWESVRRLVFLLGRGLLDSPPVELRYFTGSLRTNEFDFSKSSLVMRRRTLKPFDAWLEEVSARSRGAVDQ